ncbi:MAG: DUF393 domain-containing protein [Deltaproteobacteria bacterium]|nr:DUF393 domain-containing protein [Deltaproteobacteria bacterium]
MTKPVVIYDGECPFCRRAIAWYRAHDPAGHMEYLSRQSPERLRRYPIFDDPKYQGSIQLLMPEGAIFSGAEATGRTLTYLHGWRWRWLGACIQWPGIRSLARIGYRWIAKNRHRFACKDDSCRLP